MKLKQALDVFGTQYKIAKALDINESAVARWNKRRIPMARAWQLHMLSSGKLPFDPTAYSK
jgi:DNA-binding transcriptional regulator YdaS (Cro superfamily)